MSISFTKGSSYDGTSINGGLIYENGPENIGLNLISGTFPNGKKDAAKGRSYNIITLQSGKIYEVEFYNWNYSGKTVRIGIGIKNISTSATGTVTILKSSIAKGSSGITVGSKMTLNFMNSSVNSLLSIPVNSSANTTQGFKSLISTTFSNGQIANGRVRFKVNSSNLQCKIFFVIDGTDWEKRAGWTNKISNEDLDLNDPISGKYSAHEYRTGLYSYVQRYGKLSTNAETIAMGNAGGNVVKDDYNSGEFEIPTNTLGFSKKGNQGNFGIVYALYGTNANAKKVTFTPTQNNSANDKYVVKVNGKWKIVNASETVTLTGGTSIWFVLPGGAHGRVNVKYSI